MPEPAVKTLQEAKWSHEGFSTGWGVGGGHRRPLGGARLEAPEARERAAACTAAGRGEGQVGQVRGSGKGGREPGLTEAERMKSEVSVQARPPGFRSCLPSSQHRDTRCTRVC